VIEVATHSPPRVLFYLPVVTPWWFTNIIVPFIRAANRGGEVHVLVPPFWCGTGIGVEQLADCVDIEGVHWHILDRADHPDLRFDATKQDYLFELVHEIGPDVTLCRSADLKTPALFPGVVRYIMEGATPPFTTPSYSTQIAETLFDHAIMPSLDPALERWLDSAIASHWDKQKSEISDMERDEFLAHADLPSDKLLLGLPLEYEHEEIYWDQHYLFANNIELIDALAGLLDQDAVLAVTQHPLNNSAGAEKELRAAIERHAGKVRLVQPFGVGGQATNQMIKHCHGIVVCNSKSFAMAAFRGVPMLRISKFASGEWLRAYTALPPFLAALRDGTALAADEADARRWVAYHHANCVLDPYCADFDAHAIVDRAINRVNPARWREGLARFLNADADSLPPLPILDGGADLPLAVGM
jgi:hypothetical protein